jgi:hypothetical protein
VLRAVSSALLKTVSGLSGFKTKNQAAAATTAKLSKPAGISASFFHCRGGFGLIGSG